MEEAKKELHEGCTTETRLSFIMKMLYVKSYNRVTNRAFDQFMAVLCACLPNVRFPKSYAEAKSVLTQVGLGYDIIHVCKYDCALFWGDHAKKNSLSCVWIFKVERSGSKKKRFLTRCFDTFL